MICQNDSGGACYRGYRLSDGATLELEDVIRGGGSPVAISSAGLQTVQNGEVVSSEPAVESAS